MNDSNTARMSIGWVVDVQNDFMRPDGRLYVRDLADDSDPGAEAARERIERAVAWMLERCRVVVFTGDWHGYDDAEIEPDDPNPDEGTYPPHCMGRSDDPDEREGALLIDSIRPEAPVVLDLDASPERAREVARLALDEARPIFIRKTRFDVFRGNPATESLVSALEALSEGRPRFFVAGVARDVCVTGAVDGLQERGYEVAPIRDAMWGLGLEAEEETLDRWRRKGAEILDTSALPDGR